MRKSPAPIGSPAALRWRLAAGLTLGLAACGETAPELGAVRFVAHLDGAASDLDPDGFQVSGLFEASTVEIPAGAGVTIDALPAEQFALTLGDIAANCGVTDGEARTITVVPGDTVEVSWSVTCGARPVTLTVGFVTPGDAAAGWLELKVGDDAPIVLHPGDQVVFDQLAPGSYPLSITEAPNCRVQSPLVHTVHLASGAQSSLVLNGACSSGRIVFDVAGRLWRVNPDGTGLSEVSELGDVVAATPSLAPDGAIAFTQHYRGLTVVDWTATDLRVLTWMNESLESPAWSPDGSRIAFMAIDPATESWDIHVIDRDGSNLRNISNSPHQEHRPTWTRDGNRIFFSAGLSGTSAIYSINPDGTDRDSLAEGENPVQSPASDIIAFFGGGMLRLMDADGQNVRTVPESFNFSGPLAWSPDGRLLIFYAGALAEKGIATVDVTGRVKLLVPEFGGMLFPTVSWGR